MIMSCADYYSHPAPENSIHTWNGARTMLLSCPNKAVNQSIDCRVTPVGPRDSKRIID